MTQKFSILQSRTLNPRGMALVLCLLLLTILCLVGGAALSVSGLNHQIVSNGAKQAQAFYMAEAGRRMALAYLNDDPMWRGDLESSSGIFEGELAIGGNGGAFSVALSDCTEDENGIFSAFLPAGYVLLESTGTWIDAVQTVSCTIRLTPKEGTEAAFPRAAVVSAGSVTGPLAVLDDLGVENTALLKAPITLPEANMSALKAMAQRAFPSLGNDVWDAALNGIDSFWLDSPSDTRPRILYVQGDLDISGTRQLYGIVFVEGRHVTVDEASGIHGVLYAPNATSVTIHNTGASGRIVVSGMIITGSGGVAVSGNQATFQHSPDYEDAFNIAAGSKVDADMVSGSWTSTEFNL